MMTVIKIVAVLDDHLDVAIVDGKRVIRSGGDTYEFAFFKEMISKAICDLSQFTGEDTPDDVLREYYKKPVRWLVAERQRLVDKLARILG
jgi:hypothetical protein